MPSYEHGVRLCSSQRQSKGEVKAESILEGGTRSYALSRLRRQSWDAHIHIVSLPGEQRAAYLAGEPADDGRFLDGFAHALEHAGGYSPEEARDVAGHMLPDVIRYDHREPPRYPDNGRTLTDDVPDYFLPLLTNGKVTSDGVGPHTDLLDEFLTLAHPTGATRGESTFGATRASPTA